MEILGYLMLAIPFVVFFFMLGREVGFKVALIIYVSSATITAWVVLLMEVYFIGGGTL